MLKESVKCVPSKFQIKFQEFSRKFFSILLLHGSHRSYPSRRKACFANYIVCFISLAQTFCCSFCDISVIVGASGIVVIGGVRFDVMIFCCCQ